MKKIVLILLLALAIIWGSYYLIKGLNTEDPGDDNNISKCDKNHTCEKLDDTTHSWSKITRINISNEYNYDKDEMEAGYLLVDDNYLVFKDLANNIIKTYSNIDGAVQYILELNKCDGKAYYAITEDGIIYTADSGDGLLSEEPFHMLESEYTYTEIESTYGKDSETECENATVLGKTKENKIINILNDTEV